MLHRLIRLIFLRIPVNDSFFYPMAPFWVSNLDKQNQLVFESQRC